MRAASSIPVMAIVAVMVGLSSAAQAATVTVSATNDPAGESQCSLREAIAAINAFGTPTACGTADSSGNTIVLGQHVYTL